jgi:CheY-like chemotaxis protein
MTAGIDQPSPCRRRYIIAGLWLAAALPQTAGAAGDAHFDPPSPVVTFGLALGIALGASFILRRMARATASSGGSTGQPITPAPTGAREKLAEDDDFAKFVTEFKSGPKPSDSIQGPVPAATGSRTEAGGEKGRTARGGGDLKEFYTWAAGQTRALGQLVEKCSRTESRTTQHDLLTEALHATSFLKHRASPPELRPAWQLATALEGLLKQLTSRGSNINHSTLRTLANGLELLGDLCEPGVRPDLETNPAIRILAVDDDAVSRFTLCAALKKALDEPEVAESGEKALALAREHRYDLIILDVLMPGMDGFEVCTRIREGTCNGTTPVLFVTSLRDFDARTRILTAGGTDLVAKPFLAFEITVKSLTLILRARLKAREQVRGIPAAASPLTTAPVSWPSLPAAPVLNESDAPGEHDVTVAAGPVAMLPPPIFVEADRGLGRTDGNAPRKFSPVFLEFITASILDMADQIAVTGRTEEGQARWEMLARLHLRLVCLVRRIEVPELRPTFELCQALEGLFKKFKENPKNATDSALHTAATALELLGDLCRPGVKPDLAHNPGIRILVVDDEPLARRAITGALQMAFSKPVAVENGEAAMALAAEHEFDLVFMDVVMPEMDGFTVCGGIRKTPLNHATPVVFVTTLTDPEFRGRAAQSGGTDYVVKPFIFTEITLKALTHALRGRLEKSRKTMVGGATATG